MSGVSHAWSWRHAFAQSSLPATTKHVLHTLGMFMNELGEGCYPSVADICRYSGLDKKTVLKHLATARDAGWIAVSQHGYRGQKWKRQEYAARWPGRADEDGRDLVAACPPGDDEEGGGAVPPPSGGSKVVESVPEGGGIEGSKVVEQLHQDKTSPVTTPDTSPVERERASARTEEREIRRWLKRHFPVWPDYAVQSEDVALRYAMLLTAAERDAAVDRMADYLAAEKAAGGKSAYSVYLREKRWEKLLPRRTDTGPVEAKPFGKAGMAMRFARLVAGPTFTAFRLTPIDERMIAEGKADRAVLLKAKQSAQGFPEIVRADEMRSVTVPPEIAALGEGFVQARRGDARFVAWERLHADRGWPWLPKWVEWVWLPPGEEEVAMSEFEAAIRGEAKDHDGGGREAAE